MKIAADHPAHLAFSALNRQHKHVETAESTDGQGPGNGPAFQLDLSKAGKQYLNQLKKP